VTDRFARGKRAWFHDQRDGLRKPYRDMVSDGQYPGMKVAKDTYDPKHPQETPLTDVSDPQGLERGTGDTDAFGVSVVLPVPEFGVGPAILSMSEGATVIAGVVAEGVSLLEAPQGFQFLVDDQGVKLVDSSGIFLYGPEV